MKKILMLCLSFLSFNSQAVELKIGQPAPDFALYDQHNKLIKLTDQQGQWVVLYFYPKNDTPGCTTEACSFRDNINQLIQQESIILGVSLDDQESHQAFTNKYNLPFSLLADNEGEVARTYDSLIDLKILKFAKRNSFIIDPNGNIAKMYEGVDPEEHVHDVLKDLKALQGIQNQTANARSNP